MRKINKLFLTITSRGALTSFSLKTLRTAILAHELAFWINAPTTLPFLKDMNKQYVRLQVREQCAFLNKLFIFVGWSHLSDYCHYRHVLSTILNPRKTTKHRWTRCLHYVDFHKPLDIWGTSGACNGVRATAVVTQCYVATRQQQPVGRVCVTRWANVLEAIVLFFQSQQFWK